MTDITPSEEQTRAIKAISDWYKNSNKPYFYLAGFAGSGKTTIAKLAVQECGLNPDKSSSVRYASFTGKAALVMRRKGMGNASTVHGLIYRLIDDSAELVFEQNFVDSPMLDADIAVLDECSMVNTEMGLDLLRYKKKILVLGDPGQIKPVHGTGYFIENEPDFFLREIHRQALENPIIRMSKEVRETGQIPMCDLGEFRKIYVEDASDAELMGADQILTGKHVSRHDLNRMLLDYSGYDVELPLRSGIKVICIRNDRKTGLLNGMIGYTTADRDPLQDVNREKNYFVQSVEFPDDGGLCHEDMIIYTGPFEDHWRKRSKQEIDDDKLMIRRYQQFDFGYAITVHKSQGSQWDNIYLYDDGFAEWDMEERKRWLYTAVTRAAERVTILV